MDWLLRGYAMLNFFQVNFRNLWVGLCVVLFATGCDSRPHSIKPSQDNALAETSLATAASDRPSMSYWHVWTDSNGVTHQTRCEVSAFDLHSISPGAAPEWIDKLSTSEATVLIVVQPVGWIGEWHENPKPQWVIPLSGRWFVETMDGTRVEMGPGEVSFGHDQNSKPDAQGHRGHRSGTVGDEPSVVMVVQVKQPLPSGNICPFK